MAQLGLGFEAWQAGLAQRPSAELARLAGEFVTANRFREQPVDVRDAINPHALLRLTGEYAIEDCIREQGEDYRRDWRSLASRLARPLDEMRQAGAGLEEFQALKDLANLQHRHRGLPFPVVDLWARPNYLTEPTQAATALETGLLNLMQSEWLHWTGGGTYKNNAYSLASVLLMRDSAQRKHVTAMEFGEITFAIRGTSPSEALGMATTIDILMELGADRNTLDRLGHAAMAVYEGKPDDVRRHLAAIISPEVFAAAYPEPPIPEGLRADFMRASGHARGYVKTEAGFGLRGIGQDGFLLWAEDLPKDTTIVVRDRKGGDEIARMTVGDNNLGVLLLPGNEVQVGTQKPWVVPENSSYWSTARRPQGSVTTFSAEQRVVRSMSDEEVGFFHTLFAKPFTGKEVVAAETFHYADSPETQLFALAHRTTDNDLAVVPASLTRSPGPEIHILREGQRYTFDAGAFGAPMSLQHGDIMQIGDYSPFLVDFDRISPQLRRPLPREIQGHYRTLQMNPLQPLTKRNIDQALHHSVTQQGLGAATHDDPEGQRLFAERTAAYKALKAYLQERSG